MERYRVGLELLGPVDGKRVLDAGCGFGTLQQFIPAVGVDRHLKNLARAKAGPTAKTLIAARLSSIPFPDAHFDDCLMLETLEHVEEESRVLAEIYRVLKRGGRLILSVPHHRWLYNFIDLEHWLVPLISGRPVHRHYKKKYLFQKLAAAGFRIEDSLERGMLIAACMRWCYAPFDLCDYFRIGSFNGPCGRGIRRLFDRFVDWEFNRNTNWGGTLFVVARK